MLTILSNNILKRFRLLLLGFVLYGTLAAQSGRPVRLEFPAERYSSEMRRVLCDTLGVCLLYPLTTTDTAYCVILQYDVNLTLMNESRNPLPTSMGIVASAFDGDKLFILCQQILKKRKQPDGLLLIYSLTDHTTEQHPVGNLPTSDIAHFSVHNGSVIFTAPSGNSTYNIFYLPNGDKSVHALYLSNAPEYTVDDYLMDSQEECSVVCVNTSPSTRNNVLWLCETNLAGHIQRVIDFPDTGVYRFQNARIALLAPGRYLLSGTYQPRKASGNMAAGVYSCIYEEHHFQQPMLYPFHQTQATGRTSTDVLYLAGNIYTSDSLYAFVSESFYPEYRYTTTYSYGVPTTEPVFMGYRFIDAEVHVFDPNGRRCWNYSIPFDNIMVTNLTTHLRVSFLTDYILYHFTMGQSLTTMLTDRQFQLEDPIRTVDLFPTTSRNNANIYTTNLSQWHGDDFLLSGYRFRQGSAKSKMPVYFLSKLRYQ